MAGPGLVLAFLLITVVSADSGRSAANSIRINDLEERLHALQEEVENRKEGAREKVQELQNLEDKVHELEGDDCEKQGRFQCGGDKKECISKLLACDGFSDCDNGHDESDTQCRDLAHAGVVLEGPVSGEHCAAHSNPTHIKIAITQERRLHWFPSVEEITALIDIDYADGHTFEDTFHGRYYFGTNTLVIHHGEGHRAIDIQCRFPGAKTDHCNAKFVREASGEVCGTAILHAYNE